MLQSKGAGWTGGRGLLFHMMSVHEVDVDVGTGAVASSLLLVIARTKPRQTNLDREQLSPPRSASRAIAALLKQATKQRQESHAAAPFGILRGMKWKICSLSALILLFRPTRPRFCSLIIQLSSFIRPVYLAKTCIPGPTCLLDVRSSVSHNQLTQANCLPGH